MCGKFGMQKNDGFLSMLLGTFFLFVEYILLKVESFPTNSTNCFIRNTKQKIKPRLSIQWKKIHIWTRQPPSHTNAHREQQSQTDSDTQKNPQTKMKKKIQTNNKKREGKKPQIDPTSYEKRRNGERIVAIEVKIVSEKHRECVEVERGKDVWTSEKATKLRRKHHHRKEKEKFRILKKKRTGVVYWMDMGLPFDLTIIVFVLLLFFIDFEETIRNHWGNNGCSLAEKRGDR